MWFKNLLWKWFKNQILNYLKNQKDYTENLIKNTKPSFLIEAPVKIPIKEFRFEYELPKEYGFDPDFPNIKPLAYHELCAKQAIFKELEPLIKLEITDTHIKSSIFIGLKP